MQSVTVKAGYQQIHDPKAGLKEPKDYLKEAPKSPKRINNELPFETPVTEQTINNEFATEADNGNYRDN